MAGVFGLRGRERSALERDTTTEVLCRADIDPARSELEKGRICKELVVDFPLDYEIYAKAHTEEECMKVLAREFTRFIETMPYPMELRDTFDRKAFEQRVRDTLVRHELL